MVCDRGLGDCHVDHEIHVRVGRSDVVDESVIDGLPQKGRRLKIEGNDEVYHPSVIIRCAREARVTEVEPLGLDEEKSNKAEPTILVDVVKKAEAPEKRRSGLRVWCSRLGTVAVVLVAVVAVALVGMRIAGFRTFTVMSGSMEPNYPVGSMLYV